MKRKNSIGNFIKRFRKKGKFSTREAAKMFKVTCSAVAQWESGATTQSYTSLYNIALATGIPYWILLKQHSFGLYYNSIIAWTETAIVPRSELQHKNLLKKIHTLYGIV